MHRQPTRLDFEIESGLFCRDALPKPRTLDYICKGIPFHDMQISRGVMMWLDMEAEAFRVQEEEVDSVCWMDFDECCKGVENNTFNHCIVMEELEILKQ